MLRILSITHGETGESLDMPGQYIFTDLDEVDSIIAELESVKEDIAYDGLELRAAYSAARSPAEDGMSRSQVRAYRDSLAKAMRHNETMAGYVTDQIDKLSAALSGYTDADTASASQLRSISRVDQ
jgi:hypothetical protein